MFKEYSHISSQIQCYTILINPYTLLILKKKIHLSKSRARAKKQEYTFAKATVNSHSSLLRAHTAHFLSSLYPRLELCSILN
jgi:hypothetical protein